MTTVVDAPSTTDQPPPPESPLAPAPVPELRPAPRRGFLWGRLGVQSKLLAMLLAVSILSILVGGFFGYRTGSRSLTAAAFNQLVSVQDGRTRAVNSYLAGLQRSVVLNSLNDTAVQAMADLTRDFGQLRSATVTPADQTALEKYYDEVFIPELAKNTDGEVAKESFLPTDTASRYLQAKYTAQFTDFDAAIAADDVGDGSAWSRDHAKYHPFFREVVQRYDFEDAMLVDTEGNVVYSAYKGVDLGTNLLTGPYKDSALETAYRDVLRTNAVNAVTLTDFEPYAPSANVPTAFGLSPIGDNGRLTGVLLLQLPVSAINAAMTADQQWGQTGLGETGETYLVGPDHTLRSTSRLLIEDPEAYRAAVVAQGTPPTIADRIIERQNPILLQQVDSPSVEAALRGQTGTTTETDYLGRTVLTSYAPLTVGDTNWAVIAQIDRDEALRPVNNFLRTLGLSVLAVVLLVTLASILLARAFSRPINRLLEGVRRVASGDLGSRVDVRGTDEFADLGNAFNDMSASLATKQQLLDEQMAENDRMLRNLMPATVARRYKEGEQNIVEEHTDVSVLYATLDGSDDLGIGRTPTEAIALLNELVRSFEVAAQSAGIEKVRVVRSGYIASCGLAVPRVDHALRTLDFAREMVAIVERFNNQYGANLKIRIGIDSGSVTTGLVGPAAMYDMWGDSVTLAYRVQAAESGYGIFITGNVYDKIRDAATFAEAGTVATKTGEEPVWRLEESARA